MKRIRRFRRPGTTPLSAFRNRPALMIAPALLIIAVIAFVYFLVAFGPRPMAGAYMEPAISEGQDITIDYSYYASNPFQRGDIVAIKFKTADEPSVTRIVAIEGDAISFQTGSMILNGQLLAESYLPSPYLFSDSDLRILSSQIERYGGVPPDKLLVLNDNRDISRDSRTYGFIPDSYVIGKVLLS
jgi:signal peptidase I